MKRDVYIIHGYGASPEKHWFPWLKKTMTNKGDKVTVLTMPSPETPKVTDWLSTLKENIKEINENTYFIAHSLGTITVLRYLSEQKNLNKFGGFILVSAFDRIIQGFEELKPFIETDLDYKKINAKSALKVIIAAKDDYIVPFEYSKEIAEKLNAQFYPIEKAGHFLDRDGITELPLIPKIFENFKK